MAITASSTMDINFKNRVTDGTSALQSEYKRSAANTLNATSTPAVTKEYSDEFDCNNTTVNWDLSGSLVNKANEATVFTKLHKGHFRNLSTSVSDVVINGGGAAVVRFSLTLKPGEEALFHWLHASGVAITATTADTIAFTTTGNATISAALVGA